MIIHGLQIRHVVILWLFAWRRQLLGVCGNVPSGLLFLQRFSIGLGSDFWLASRILLSRPYDYSFAVWSFVRFGICWQP